MNIRITFHTLTTVNELATLTTYLDLIIKITVDIYLNIVDGKFISNDIIDKYKDDFHRLENRIGWERNPINLHN